jgi:hypothetical protein
VTRLLPEWEGKGAGLGPALSPREKPAPERQPHLQSLNAQGTGSKDRHLGLSASGGSLGKLYMLQLSKPSS